MTAVYLILSNWILKVKSKIAFLFPYFRMTVMPDIELDDQTTQSGLAVGRILSPVTPVR